MDHAAAAGVLYASVLGTALGYWAMAMVNRSLPAMTTSLGLLATPVVGTAGASIMLGEPITLTLISAMALIIGGIAIGTLVEAKAPLKREAVTRLPDACET